MGLVFKGLKVKGLKVKGLELRGSRIMGCSFKEWEVRELVGGMWFGA